jgi:hypothetical protein
MGGRARSSAEQKPAAADTPCNPSTISFPFPKSLARTMAAAGGAPVRRARRRRRGVPLAQGCGSLPSLLCFSFPFDSITCAAASEGKCARQRFTVRSASRHAAAEAPLFISFSFSSSPSSLAPHGARSKEWPWRPGEDVGRCAAVGPFADARVHPWVSALPSNGPVLVPLARIRSEVARRCGLISARVSWPLGVHAARRRRWQR